MADESENPEKVKKPEGLSVFNLRVQHRIPDNVGLTYSDNFIVQHTENEFTISFSQIEQPFAFTEEEYAQLSTVKAEVVARIVISPLKMRELIKALIDNWNLNQEQAKKRLEEFNVSIPAHITPIIFTASDDTKRE